ncbi:hypothetical protein FF1_034858 [Malus domestica]
MWAFRLQWKKKTTHDWKIPEEGSESLQSMEAFGAKTTGESPGFMPRKSWKMVCLPEKYQSSKDKSNDLSSVETLSPRRWSSRSATEGGTLSMNCSSITQ